MTAYQNKLQELLILSTLTPGYCIPSEHLKIGKHAAVFVDKVPVYLSGYADDSESMEHAARLAQCEMLALGLRHCGFTGKITHGTVLGRDIVWEPKYTAIVESDIGIFEKGNTYGVLVGVNLTQSMPLSVLMCVNDSIARILSPNCPPLDNGVDLSLLAGIDQLGL